MKTNKLLLCMHLHINVVALAFKRCLQWTHPLYHCLCSFHLCMYFDFLMVQFQRIFEKYWNCWCWRPENHRNFWKLLWRSSNGIHFHFRPWHDWLGWVNIRIFFIFFCLLSVRKWSVSVSCSEIWTEVLMMSTNTCCPLGLCLPEWARHVCSGVWVS